MVVVIKAATPSQTRGSGRELIGCDSRLTQFQHPRKQNQAQEHLAPVISCSKMPDWMVHGDAREFPSPAMELAWPSANFFEGRWEEDDGSEIQVV